MISSATRTFGARLSHHYMRFCSDRNISDHLRKWRSYMRRVPGWIISDNLRQARRLYALRSRPDQLGPVAVRHHGVRLCVRFRPSLGEWITLTQRAPPARHGKRRSSSARAWTPDSPKRCAQWLSQSWLSRKNFQSLMTPCLTNTNGTGDWNGRKLALYIAVPSWPS